MNCERANEVLMLDLYGEAAASDSAELHAHLAECSECRHAAEATRSALKEFRRAPEPHPSREIVATIIEEAQPRPRLLEIFLRLRPAFLQAVAVVFIAAALSAAIKFWPQKTSPTVAVAVNTAGSTNTVTDADVAWNSDVTSLANRIRLAQSDSGFGTSVDNRISALRDTLEFSRGDSLSF